MKVNKSRIIFGENICAQLGIIQSKFEVTADLEYFKNGQ